MLHARCADRWLLDTARVEEEGGEGDTIDASSPIDAPNTPSHWFWFPRWPPKWRASSAKPRRRPLAGPRETFALRKISFSRPCTPSSPGKKDGSRYATSAAATAPGSFSKDPTD